MTDLCDLCILGLMDNAKTAGTSLAVDNESVSNLAEVEHAAVGARCIVFDVAQQRS